MESNLFLKEFRGKLEEISAGFVSELKIIHTGRVHPSILDGVLVEAYETKLPLNQTAAVLVSGASILKVTPFDINNINPIRNAIASNEKLNLNPTDDGRVIYISVPPLTTERRQQIVKGLHALKENFLVKLRQARHQILKHLKKELTAEEEIKSLEKQVETLMTETRGRIEKLTQEKADEILDLQ